MEHRTQRIDRRPGAAGHDAAASAAFATTATPAVAATRPAPVPPLAGADRRIARMATAARAAWSGVSYQALVLLFMGGSVLGFLLEGVWWMVRYGRWESHSATVWGPFCTIYGVGVVAVYLLHLLVRRRPPIVRFVWFALAGSVVEYVTSLLQEHLLGMSTWDYSCAAWNLDGRISLSMTLLWGMLGTLCSVAVCPALSRALAHVRGRAVTVVCVALTLFMAVDCGVSGMAMARWSDRQDGVADASPVGVMLDEAFDDATMARLFPNVKFVRSAS